LPSRISAVQRAGSKLSFELPTEDWGLESCYKCRAFGGIFAALELLTADCRLETADWRLLTEYACHERPRLESRGNSIFLAWEPVFLLMDLQKL